MKTMTVLSILCFFLSSCYFGQGYKKDYCLEEQLSYVLSNDNEAKLHSKEELLFILNFKKTEISDLRVALIPKMIYPKYLIGKADNKLKGYFEYAGVVALAYGDIPDFLNLENVEGDMSYLNPFKMPLPNEGFPPFPPFVIEPLVYCFVLEGNCYSLRIKTVSLTLLD